MKTQEQKLKAIIEKAVGNGFEWSEGDWAIIEKPIQYHNHRFQGWSVTYTSIIFSHDFAKAFWGDQRHTSATCDVCKTFLNQTDPMYCFQYNLTQLALTPDNERIDYLYKFI